MSKGDRISGMMLAAPAVCLVVLSRIASVMSFWTVPRSSVVVKGDRVELNCNLNGNHSVTWTFTSWNSSHETSIYLGEVILESMRSRYTIDKHINGQHNLIINSIDMAYAGRYLCRKPKANLSDEAAAQLTVLDSDPECGANVSLAGGTLLMWCHIIYAGNMIPIFRWTKNNTQDAVVANTTTYGSRAVALTTTSSVITQLRSHDNGVTFKCKITFQLPNSAEGNVPDYEYTWNYTLYGPRNLSIIINGSSLICSADGNPTPTYTWTHVDKNIATVGSVVELDASYDRDQTFKCTAVNAIAAENKYLTVPGSANSDDKSNLSTAEVALIIALLNLAGFVILVTGLGLRKLSSFINAGRGFSRRDSQARASSIQMHPPMPPNMEKQDSQPPTTNDKYCALTERPQEPQLYSELRLYEQPSTNYINQPSTEK